MTLTMQGTGTQARIPVDPHQAGGRIPADPAQAGLAPHTTLSPDPTTAAAQAPTVTLTPE